VEHPGCTKIRENESESKIIHIVSIYVDGVCRDKMNSWGILYVICFVCIHTTGQAFENSSTTPIPETTTTEIITSTPNMTVTDDYNSTTPLPSEMITESNSTTPIPETTTTEIITSTPNMTVTDDYNSTTPLPSGMITESNSTTPIPETTTTEIITSTPNMTSLFVYPNTTTHDDNSTTPVPENTVPGITTSTQNMTVTNDYNSTTPVPSGMIRSPNVSIDDDLQQTADDAIWTHSIAIVLAVSVIPVALCIYLAKTVCYSTVYNFPLDNANEIEHAVVIPVETVPGTEPSVPGLQADYLDESGYETPRVRFSPVEPPDIFQMS
jgi:hypothetical protein